MEEGLINKYADCGILFHKEVPYGVWNDEIFTPIQVSAAENGRISQYGGYADNEGDGISEWNCLFAELTGLYWVWKHLTGKKYAGIIQYRRRFDIHTAEELDALFKKNKVLTMVPLTFTVSVADQYRRCHNTEDLVKAKEILLRLHPEYEQSWEQYVERACHLFYSNGFIMGEEDFKKYCEWLFGILFEYQKEMGWETPEEVLSFVEAQIKARKRPCVNGNGKPDGALRYQSQIFGFLSERLWTLYLQHNYKPEEIGLLPYLKMEAGI